MLTPACVQQTSAIYRLLLHTGVIIMPHLACPALISVTHVTRSFAASTLIDRGSKCTPPPLNYNPNRVLNDCFFCRFLAAMDNLRIGVFQSKLHAMMEEVSRARNGFTLTAASALVGVSPASDTAAPTTLMTITDIYIVDTLPPEPFDSTLLAGPLPIRKNKALNP